MAAITQDHCAYGRWQTGVKRPATSFHSLLKICFARFSLAFSRPECESNGRAHLERTMVSTGSTTKACNRHAIRRASWSQTIVVRLV